MKDMDLVVQFAILWGMEIGSAMKPSEFRRVAEMKNYDSEELSTLFVQWKDEYLKQDEIEDSCDFFNMKLKELLS